MATSIQEALRQANQNVRPAPEAPVNTGASPDAELDRITTDVDEGKTPLDNATDITVLGGAIKLQNVVLAQLQERIVQMEEFLAQLVEGASAVEEPITAPEDEIEEVPGTEPIE